MSVGQVFDERACRIWQHDFFVPVLVFPPVEVLHEETSQGTGTLIVRSNFVDRCRVSVGRS